MTPDDDLRPATDGELTPGDWQDLARAHALLRQRSFAAGLMDMVGRPIERGLALLPANVNRQIGTIAHAALEKALGAALLSVRPDSPLPSRDGLHKLAVAATGAVGGLLGLPGLAVELPLATTIILRSIAEIARSEGEDVTDPAVKLECVSVFALSDTGSPATGVETGYFMVRSALASEMAAAASHLARGASGSSAPAVLNVLRAIGGRFGVIVSEKWAAQAVPVLGAIGGATLNTLFIEHFQNIARGHFIVRRLERRLGKATVRMAYDALDPASDRS